MVARIQLVVLALIIALAPSSAADGVTFVVIANPKSGITEIDRDQLREIYLKKVTEVAGEGVHPVDLTTRFPIRDEFIHDVIRKTPSQLKRYWSQQIFTGKGVPPPEAESPAAVIAYVLGHPGAIGYVPQGVDPGAARVVRLR